MLKNNLESPETLEALTLALDAYNKYAKKTPEGANWDWYQQGYANGEFAFLPEYANLATNLVNMGMALEDIGYVAMPMGPSADHYIGWVADNVYAIPACYDADRAWKVAFAYNLYTADIPGFENNDNWKSGYYNKFGDMRDVDESLQVIMDGAALRFDAIVAGMEIYRDLTWDLGTANKSADGSVETPAQSAERIRPLWEEDIANANK